MVKYKLNTIILLCILVLFLFFNIWNIYKHFTIKRENIDNIGVDIGNYLCNYFYELGLSITRKNDFYYEQSDQEVVKYLPTHILFINDPLYGKYIEEISKEFKRQQIDEDYLQNKLSFAIWFIEDPKNIIFWNTMKPLINTILDNMFTKGGLNINKIQYPIIHFRCADVPFTKHQHYHLVKYPFYKEALDIITNKSGIQYKKVIILSCNTHFASIKNKEKCGVYINSIVEYLNSIGYEVETQCNSNIDDFAQLFYAPAVISNVSSFSFMSGYFGNGIFISSEHNDENNTEETCNICGDWMLKGHQLKHKFVEDYNDTENVIKQLLL